MKTFIFSSVVCLFHAASMEAAEEKVFEKEEGRYELTISGRSKSFNIDRILFVHKEVGLARAQRDNPEEGASVVGSPSGVSSSSRVTRKLTNQGGRVIEAELLERQGENLRCRANGRRNSPPLSTLTEMDRDHVRIWHGLR